MSESNTQTLLVAAAAVCTLAAAGIAWRALSVEPPKAAVGLQGVVPRTSMETPSAPKGRPELHELVGVDRLETAAVRRAREAQEAAQSAAESVPSDTPEEAAGTSSMEITVELPPRDRVEGQPLRVVLDDPQGRAVKSTFETQAELPRGTDKVILENLPVATSFRLSVFQGADLYARTRVDKGGLRTSVDLDFVEKQEQERTAVATLRSIAAAQQQLQASAAIDTDADGGGEHGYFAELAGATPIRSYTAGGPAVEPNGVRLNPTYLPKSFGELESTGAGGAMVRNGYAYLIYLPDSSDSPPVAGLPESMQGGNGQILPGSSNAELMWCCYAWPVDSRALALKAMMINQAGDVITTDNASGRRYIGLGSAPPFDAAYSTPGDMASSLAIGADNLHANDGNTWTPTGN